MDRAAGSARIKRRDLLRQLAPELKWRGRPPDFDRWLPEPVRDSLCAALGMDRAQAKTTFQRMQKGALAPAARIGYCPRCFLEDLQAGRTPYFRWQWASPFVTLCPWHEVPICRWRSTFNNQRILPVEWVFTPSSYVSSACPWFDEDLRLCDQGERELGDEHSPLQTILQLQRHIVDLSGNGDFEQLDFQAWWGFKHKLAEVSAYPSPCSLPVAATDRPQDCPVGLFEVPHTRDYPRRRARAYKAFFHAAYPGWRRSVMYVAAAHQAAQCGSVAVNSSAGNGFDPDGNPRRSGPGQAGLKLSKMLLHQFVTPGLRGLVVRQS